MRSRISLMRLGPDVVDYCLLSYAKQGPTVDNELHELRWNAIGYAISAALALATLFGLWRTVPALKRPWLPLDRLRPGAWTGGDVLLALCIFFGFQVLVIDLLNQLGVFDYLVGPRPDDKAPAVEARTYLVRCSAVSSPLLLTLILGLWFGVLYVRTQHTTRPHHYGLSWARWPSNVALGIVGFVVAAPIVLGLYAGLGLLMSAEDHGLTTLGR